MPSLSSIIPEIDAFQRAQSFGQQQQLGQLQQMGALQGILSKVRAEQEAQAFRGALSQAKTPEEQAAIAARFGGPDAVLRVTQGSLDRKAALDAANMNRQDQRDQRLHELEIRGKQEIEKVREAAAQNRITKEEADRREAAMRENMARLAASLRPAPADKTPMGYRLKPDGNLEAIPGGPADNKMQGALNQDTASMQSMTSDLDRLANEANAIKESAGLDKATGWKSILPVVGGIATMPGTDAANFKARLETLKSQVAFGVLQNMRNNSKTGGALGQVSDKEGALLQANLAALDRAQSPAEFKAALGRIIDYTEEAKGRLRNAYNMKHSGRPAATPTTPPPPEGFKPL